MKILLARYYDGPNINTRLPKSLNRIRGVMPPLGLLSIAAYLEQFGYEPKVLDAVAANMRGDDFAAAVRSLQPDVCGVTTMLENYHGAIEACQIAKRAGAMTVLGGPGLETFPAEMIDRDYIDYGVVGEGEETFLGLVRALESRDRKMLEGLAGLSYKRNGTIIAGKPQVVRDLDALPPPAYHLIDINRYSSLINDFPILTYVMGRGCPFHCSFCIKQEADKVIRFRAPGLVVEDMERLVSRYRIKEFMFYDDTFTLSVKQTRGVCDEILRRKLRIKFEAPTRVDHLSGPEGKDLLRRLKQAGCYRLRLGVESGAPEILARMHKRIRLETVAAAFQNCREAGIETFAYFMVGYLGESRDAFERSVNLAIRLDPDYTMFTIATPYPKTRLYAESQAAGLVPANYWRDFIQGKTSARIPYLVPGADKLAQEAYRRFYFRPRYILRRLARLRTRQHLKNALGGLSALLSYRRN